MHIIKIDLKMHQEDIVKLPLKQWHLSSCSSLLFPPYHSAPHAARIQSPAHSDQIWHCDLPPWTSVNNPSRAKSHPSIFWNLRRQMQNIGSAGSQSCRWQSPEGRLCCWDSHSSPGLLPFLTAPCWDHHSVSWSSSRVLIINFLLCLS